MRVIKVRHEALIDSITPELKKALTFKVKNQHTEIEKEIIEYRPAIDGVWIPRATMSDLITRIEDAGWQHVSIAFKGTLKPYQEELVNNFLNSNRNGVISAGTGSGKTVMGLYIAHKIGLKTLVVVPTDRIFHQWIERCQRFCGFTPSVIRGNICEYDKPITVAMLQTLAIGKRINKKVLYKEFGLTIYDEVHRLPTEKFSVVARMFWDKYRLGLSATPTRKDGLHNLFFNHIGKVLTQYHYTKLKPKVYMLKYIDYETSAVSCMWNGKLNTAKYLNQLIEVGARNKLIAFYIYHGYRQGRKILMLTDRLEHINKVKHHLNMLGIKDDEIGFITGAVKEIGKPILLGTYGSAGLGLDIPELDYLVLATPRTDIRQAIGRVLRPKKKSPIVIDIVDNIAEVMRKYGKVREKFYRRLGCHITEAYINREVINVKFQELLVKK